MDMVCDIIGIGFGPANLSLAIALQEHAEQSGNKLQTVFFEQKPAFGWFPEMLLPGATMQVSFLKDLVSLRNPCSPYSFLNYLKAKGRLEKFANLRDWFPTRTEFHDYFEWVADQFKSQTHYEQKTISIDLADHDHIQELRVIVENTRNYKESSFRTRNIVLALGGQPRIPDCVHAKENSTRIWHNASFLSKIASYARNEPHHFTIVGSGQSAAEICQYLYENYPDARITVVMRAFGFRAADDSEFVNEIFSSSGTERFFNAVPSLRQEILQKLANTNYVAVDADLIKALYHLHYADLVSGKNRLNILNLSELVEAKEDTDHVELTIKDRGKEKHQTLRTDALILATGYERNKPSELLKPLLPFLDLDENGDIKIDRGYRVATKSFFRAGIFIQGASEATHGISDTLLSVLPFRSAEIADQIYETVAEQTIQKQHHVFKERA